MSAQAATAPAAAPSSSFRAWVEQIMGMPISVQVRGEGARSQAADDAVRAVFDHLRILEARFSTYRPDSEIRRLQRGDVSLEACSADVREVERLCRTALERTAGAFDAWNCVPGRPGVFDPTGLVKGWAVARAARRLGTLNETGLSWAVNAGGDILVRNAPDDAVPWVIGIEDPFDRTQVLATVPVRDGAVATSGLAARGAHIVDPRRREPAVEVAAATVVGPSLTWADVFATALVVHGRQGVDWARGLHGTAGMIVMADGAVHRWANEA